MSFALTASGRILKIHPAHHISPSELKMPDRLWRVLAAAD
jgi:hypothetical protein